MSADAGEARQGAAQAAAAYDVGRRGEAFEIYLRLAEGGDTESRFFVGWMLYVGDGVAQDLGRAAYWLESAAAGGHGEAKFYLGKNCAEQGRYPDALAWYEASAADGYTPGMYRAVLMYERSAHVARDQDKARALMHGPVPWGMCLPARNLRCSCCVARKACRGDSAASSCTCPWCIE